MKQLFISLLLLAACNSPAPPQNTSAGKESPVETAPAKDSTTIPETILDPNEPKPMALAMRAMATNADSMKARLLRGDAVDSAQFPFIRFYLVEPTDPSVLEPKFFENARKFQQAYKEIFRHPGEQVKYYNASIEACKNCHMSYCNGPLKRIRKLPI